MDICHGLQTKKFLRPILVSWYLILAVLLGGLGCSSKEESAKKDSSIETANLLPLNEFRLNIPGTTVKIENGRLHITSRPKQWAYATYAPLQAISVTQGPLELVLKTKVLEGKMAFGVLTKDQKAFVVEKAVGAGSNYVDVHLHIPAIEEVGGLVIRTWADDGKVSRAIVERVEIISSSHSPRDFPRDFEEASSVLLHQLVLNEYPELGDTNTNDWKKVNILRQWAYENIDVAISKDVLLDYNEYFKYYIQKAPAIFSAFLQDKGGVFCGGTAYALFTLYQSFGYRSYIISCGNPEKFLTHATTMVEINHMGRKIITLEDAYFNLAYVDQNNGPYDIYDLLRALKSHDHQKIKILEGKGTPRDIILGRIALPNENLKSWVFALDDTNQVIIKYLPQGWTKFRTETTLEECIKGWSLTSELLSFLKAGGHPQEFVYLFLYPYSVYGEGGEVVFNQIKNIIDLP